MELIIDIDDNDYELLNKTGIEIDWNTAFHGKEKDREMTFAIFDLVKALKNGKPYEERPQVTVCAENASKEEIAEFKQELENVLKRPQGKWEKCQNDMFRCSNCGQADEVPTAMGTPIYNFCPNCGANMRGKDE